MKWKHYYYLLFLMTMHVAGYAQNDIRGRVVDMQDRPVESVAVVLQTTDSVYIDAVVYSALIGKLPILPAFYSNMCYMNRLKKKLLRMK